jgi:hypothetical protein
VVDRTRDAYRERRVRSTRITGGRHRAALSWRADRRCDLEGGGALSELALAHALELALESDADIIHCAFCQPNGSQRAAALIERAVGEAVRRGKLIVAPGGNNSGDSFCTPAALPGVLAVGAHDAAGRPLDLNNFGGPYSSGGVLAPGEKIVGAKPGGGTTEHDGTSVAAPIVTGIAALLLALSIQSGRRTTPLQIRDAILSTARPCALAAEEPERCLAGIVDVPAAIACVLATEIAATVEPASAVALAARPVRPAVAHPPQPALATIVPSSLEPAERPLSPVFAIGTIGYDFGSEARRDSFVQQMQQDEALRGIAPNPYDPRRMVAHLQARPPEARALTWTLDFDATPVYALEPTGAFAEDVYEGLVRLLAAQHVAPDGARIERVSIPGRTTRATTTLYSGQTVPVVRLEWMRGLFGWNTPRLLDGATVSVQNSRGIADDATIRRALRDFLDRVYFDFRNLGVLARDRALNYAVTNASKRPRRSAAPSRTGCSSTGSTLSRARTAESTASVGTSS